MIIQTNVDGKIVIKKKEHLLNSYILPTGPQKEIDIKLIAITRKKSNWKPPANHPWKSGSFKRREEIINSKVGHF